MFYKMLFDRFVGFTYLYTVLDMPRQIRIVCLHKDAVLYFVNNGLADKTSTEPGLVCYCTILGVSLLDTVPVYVWIVRCICYQRLLITLADAERGFSIMKLICTPLRNRLGIERQSNLIFISLVGPLLDYFNALPHVKKNDAHVDTVVRVTISPEKANHISKNVATIIFVKYLIDLSQSH